MFLGLTLYLVQRGIKPLFGTVTVKYFTCEFGVFSGTK